MVKIFTLFFLTIIVFSNPFLFSQVQEQLSSKKTELSRLRNEISSLEKELKLKSAKEKESFQKLENYNKQGFLLNKLIARLREEEELKQQDIDNSKSDIEIIEKEIAVLKKNYSRYVISIYKYGKMDELEFLVNAGSIDRAILRYKYLQKFSDKRKKDLDQYVENIKHLNVLKNKLVSEVEEKVLLENQKVSEESALKTKLNERKQILVSIRKDKDALKKEIDAKRTAEVKIKSLINKLIEESIARRKEEERLAKLNTEKKKNTLTGLREKKEKTFTEVPEYKVNLSTSGFSSFSSLRGRLNWPVSNGHVIRQFGENRNAKLNTVTINYGIDIKTAGDLNVKCVADGVVSAIDWIPGYGSVIIITHKDEFRTVYSHLSEIYVKEGDRVKSGSLLAKIGESSDGNIVHFEIWNSRNNQNPEVWLARK